MESAVEFRNKHSETLRGILHIPEKTKSLRKDIFIFPNGGIMGSEGDFRAHLRIARIIADAGYHILRFSPSGIGNSDGYIPDCKQRDLFGQFESGLLVDDIKSAIRYVQSISHFDSITLSGICGGAISSFLAAAESKEVDRVIPIGIPVILDSDTDDFKERIPEQVANSILVSYSKKLASLESWRRFFSREFFLAFFRDDLKVITKALKSKITKGSAYQNADGQDSKIHTNPKFFSAVNRLHQMDKKILFIFGDSDRFRLEFEKLFLNKFYHDWNNLPFEYCIVPNANHMLSWVEMQIYASEKIIGWTENQRT